MLKALVNVLLAVSRGRLIAARCRPDGRLRLCLTTNRNSIRRRIWGKEVGVRYGNTMGTPEQDPTPEHQLENPDGPQEETESNSC